MDKTGRVDTPGRSLSTISNEEAEKVAKKFKDLQSSVKSTSPTERENLPSEKQPISTRKSSSLANFGKGIKVSLAMVAVKLNNLLKSYSKKEPEAAKQKLEDFIRYCDKLGFIELSKDDFSKKELASIKRNLGKILNDPITKDSFIEKLTKAKILSSKSNTVSNESSVAINFLLSLVVEEANKQTILKFLTAFQTFFEEIVAFNQNEIKDKGELLAKVVEALKVNLQKISDYIKDPEFSNKTHTDKKKFFEEIKEKLVLKNINNGVGIKATDIKKLNLNLPINNAKYNNALKDLKNFGRAQNILSKDEKINGSKLLLEVRQYLIN